MTHTYAGLDSVTRVSECAYSVVFTKDQFDPIKKTASASYFEMASLSAQEKAMLITHLFLRKGREAVRDFLYREYGDSWREHETADSMRIQDAIYLLDINKLMPTLSTTESHL